MQRYSLAHLSDPDLLRGLAALVAQDRVTTAALLAHIAEVDARRLYLPAAHPSMYAYCIQELHLSEASAYKRIQAARAARKFPPIFEALAEGWLHLIAVVLLAPYQRPENVESLLAGAALKTKAEIEELLARRFPRAEAMGLIQALQASPPRANEQLAPGRVDGRGQVVFETSEHAPEHIDFETPELAPGRVGTHAQVAPVAPERFILQLTIGA